MAGVDAVTTDVTILDSLAPKLRSGSILQDDYDLLNYFIIYCISTVFFYMIFVAMRELLERKIIPFKRHWDDED